MSTPRRAYDLLRGYINHEWERIRGVEVDAAEQELNQALEGPGYRRYEPTSMDPEVLLLSDEERARRILGVGPDAGFDEIRKAFDRLSSRSDPANFPEGSAEAAHAAEIRSKVHRAFRILSDRFDATEKRFRSLEIE